VREAGILNFRCKVRETPDRFSLLIDDVQPTEPLVFIFARPQRRIARPQFCNLVLRIPVIERGFDCLR